MNDKQALVFISMMLVGNQIANQGLESEKQQLDDKQASINTYGTVGQVSTPLPTFCQT